MISIKTILCPVDFCPASDRASDYAANLARIYGAKVHLLHVITAPGTIAYEYPLDTKTIIKSLEDASSREMKTLAEKLEAKGPTIDSEIQTGDIYETIMDHISLVRPDVVVMGTHGRLGI